LIELAVVLGIIALLMALLIPAIQSAREASRRADCLSRMAQVGRALHNFEETYHYFPPLHSGREPGVSFPAWGSEYSPFAQLLPYLDQAPVFNQLNFGDGRTFGIPNDFGPLGQVRISVLLCPSDGPELGCNYRCCTGQGAYDWDHFGDQPDSGSGAFSRLKLIRPGDFTDGLSNTIGVSEKIKSPGVAAGWFPRGQFWYSGIADLLGSYPPSETVVDTCGSLSGSPSQFGWHAGGTWILGIYDYTAYNHTVGPNSPIVDCSVHDGGIQPPSWEADGGVFAARSYHPGGVNCLLMDGSARFVSDSVALEIWHGLATRGGAEIFGEY
jgi:prepilin-type processing-associated H-X9-DG protein